MGEEAEEADEEIGQVVEQVSQNDFGPDEEIFFALIAGGDVFGWFGGHSVDWIIQ